MSLRLLPLRLRMAIAPFSPESKRGEAVASPAEQDGVQRLPGCVSPRILGRRARPVVGAGGMPLSEAMPFRRLRPGRSPGPPAVPSG
jgi:hypothetical protein